MGERKPAYWAQMPARLRYDERLRPNAKLLYAEVTALLGAEGYCWASNQYLADLFGLAARTVRDLIGQLVDCGYLVVEVERDPETNEVLKRKIYTAETLPALTYPSGQKWPEGPAENGQTSGQNWPVDQSDITSNILPPKAPQSGGRRREKKTEPDWKPEIFARFWALYPIGKSKQAAIAAWDKLKPDDALIAKMSQALKRQMAQPEWKRGIGIPYASTWLNQRRWEDELRGQISADDAEDDGGWAEDPEVY